EPLTAAQRDALLYIAMPAASPPDAGFWAAYSRITPRASWAIGIAVALIFALEVLWGGSGVLFGIPEATNPTLYRMGANVPERVQAGEIYRLVSSAFLHIGLVHLAVNLWALRVFGPFLERILGTARFVVLYALSALGGGLLSFALGNYRLSAGASGA